MFHTPGAPVSAVGPRHRALGDPNYITVVNTHISMLTTCFLKSASACELRQWKEVNRTNCKGVCWASGDPHYVTFDNKAFDFMGSCSYIMVKHTDFSVIQQNVPCGSSGNVFYSISHASKATLN